MSWLAFVQLAPEGILVFTACLVYVLYAGNGGRNALTASGGPTTRGGVSPLVWSGLGTAAALVVLIYQAYNPLADSVSLGESSSDAFSLWARTLCILLAAIYLAVTAKDALQYQAGEIAGSILLAFSGVMFVSGARDLALLFVGMELVSIPTYVLIFCGRRVVKTQEAAVKYFFLSILSSAFLLYGFSFIYGHAGSLELSEIAAKTGAGLSSAAAKLGLILTLVGLGFKLAAAPFHFYAADVYDGATHPNAGLLSVLPKLTGVVVILKLVGAAMPGAAGFAWQALLVMAILSMSVGNLLALWQNKIRRMIALSGVSHSGYLLAAFAVLLVRIDGAGPSADLGQLLAEGAPAVLLYLFGYLFGVSGCFAALTAMESGNKKLETVDDLAGMAQVYPAPAFCLSICLLSLAGIPPLLGFWGKLGVLYGAVSIASQSSAQAGLFLLLALVGAVNAAIGAAYYLRLISALYFRSAESVAETTSSAAWTAAVASTLFVAICGFVPWTITNSITLASRDIVVSAQPRATTPQMTMQGAPTASVVEGTGRPSSPQGFTAAVAQSP